MKMWGNLLDLRRLQGTQDVHSTKLPATAQNKMCLKAKQTNITPLAVQITVLNLTWSGEVYQYDAPVPVSGSLRYKIWFVIPRILEILLGQYPSSKVCRVMRAWRCSLSKLLDGGKSHIKASKASLLTTALRNGLAASAATRVSSALEFHITVPGRW